MVDPDTKHSHWKMAIVVNVYRGKDGLVRSVQVKTDSGIYDRPVTKLCLLVSNNEMQDKE